MKRICSVCCVVVRVEQSRKKIMYVGGVWAGGGDLSECVEW